jgi:hypothetical protein
MSAEADASRVSACMRRLPDTMAADAATTRR